MHELPWDDSVAIIGGGPAGACLAALLAQRGFSVDVYERRPDPRRAAAAPAGAGFSAAFGQAADAAKRSINLALSHRGLAALGALGLRDAALAAAVPMPCRAIHDARGGAVTTQAYGQPGQAIHSASRGLVNELLLDVCGKFADRVRLHFSVVVRALSEDGVLSLAAAGGGGGGLPPPHPPRADYRPRLVVGADGAFSAVRGFMLRWTRMDFSRHFIEHAYKELSLRAAPRGGGWALATPHALHIWPRGEFMLIALPNTDKSFTCTLFAPWRTFEALEAGGSGAVAAFFSAHFGDVAPLFEDLPGQWAGNPTSPLMEVRCAPWAHAGRVLLIGDAAHATVPFYGQGMNAALEDALCLAEAVDAEAARGGEGGGGGGPHGALARAVAAFAAARQPAGAALCDISLEHYHEMAEKTASNLFLARAALERFLHWAAPRWWVSKYGMMAFSRVPYDEVARRSARQDAALGWALAAAAAAAGAAAAAAAWPLVAAHAPKVLARAREALRLR